MNKQTKKKADSILGLTDFESKRSLESTQVSIVTVAALIRSTNSYNLSEGLQ